MSEGYCINKAGPADIAACRMIWQRCFGDGDAYLDFYYQHGFPLFETLVLRAENEIRSMLTLIPAEYRANDICYPAAYVYAVATDPAAQGKGYASALLKAAHEHLLNKGVTVSALLPASDSLYEYYARLGYRTAFSVCVKRYENPFGLPAYGSIAPAQRETFCSLRREYLSKMSHSFSFSEKATGYLFDESAFTGGEILHLTDGKGLQGYAVCTKIEKTVVVKETNLEEPVLKQFLPGLFKRYEAESVQVKVPCVHGETVLRHGMLCPLEPASANIISSRADGYMNLVLD